MESKQIFSKIYSSQGEFIPNNTNNNTLEEILKTLQRIESRVSKIEERQTGMQAAINQLLRKNVPIATQNLFPITSLDGLCAAENAVALNIEKYTQIIKLIISPDGLYKNFNRIFSNKVIMELNYDGVNNKKPFKDYKSLNQALFDATNIEGSTKEEFVKKLRKCFRTYKSRSFKKGYDQRKKTNDSLKH